MCHHYSAKQEAGCDEQVQLHGDRYQSDLINNLHTTLLPDVWSLPGLAALVCRAASAASAEQR